MFCTARIGCRRTPACHNSGFLTSLHWILEAKEPTNHLVAQCHVQLRMFFLASKHICKMQIRQPASTAPEMSDVWLSIPSPGLVDHAWFQSHLEYPVLMALGSLVLLTLLLGCLAVEGAELYFSGIV
eukprot:symbB.v1.2.015293.t1/scaffold1134.1/size135964/5